MTKEVYVAQAGLYADGEWQTAVPSVGVDGGRLEIAAPEPLTFQQYVFVGKHSSLKEKADDEIFCPVCGCCGKEQVLDDRVRIYHPARLIPCRAPEGYELVLKISEQLVPA